MRITTALKRALRADGHSILALAKASGVSHPVILRFLSGERDIRLATADKLLRVLPLKIGVCHAKKAKQAEKDA